MKKLIVLFTIAVFGIKAHGQVQTPSASPAGSVSSTIGLTDIKIDYFRPSIKGRTIFGSAENVLVPFGKIWRTGANSGTKISFSDNVTVEGKPVEKGEYLIYTWPGEKEWSVSLYKDTKLGGNTNSYDAAQEALKFTVKPKKLSEKVETLTFTIGDIAADNKSASVILRWENTSVSFNVGVTYDEQVMASIKSSIIDASSESEINPGNYYQAAVYYLENGKDLDQALKWINKANEGIPNAFWLLYQKARIQKALGDKKGAKETAVASLESAKKEGNRDYQKMNEELIKSL